MWLIPSYFSPLLNCKVAFWLKMVHKLSSYLQSTAGAQAILHRLIEGIANMQKYSKMKYKTFLKITPRISYLLSPGVAANYGQKGTKRSLRDITKHMSSDEKVMMIIICKWMMIGIQIHRKQVICSRQSQMWDDLNTLGALNSTAKYTLIPHPPPLCNSHDVFWLLRDARWWRTGE